MRRTVFLSGVLGVSLFVAATLIGGALLPGYSHVRQFISESYALGTPAGPWLRFLGYLPSGILIAVFAWSAMRLLRVRLLGKLGFGVLGVCYGLGTAATAFFPCDAGCEGALGDPSLSQLIHNLAGFLTYLAVPPALIVIGAVLRKRRTVKGIGHLAIACGLVALVGVVLLVDLSDSGSVGLVQRVVEVSILLWIAACAIRLRTYAGIMEPPGTRPHAAPGSAPSSR